MRGSMRSDAGPAAARWQCHGGRCAAVLFEVFSWLSGKELACAGAVCCAWRRAAADPALWHRLLRRSAPEACLALEPALHAGQSVSWRQEYVSLYAEWRLEARVAVGGAPQHAALAPGGARLALVGDDAALQIWTKEGGDAGGGAGGGWREAWGAALEARGWRSAVRAEWAASGVRLLVLGVPQLADSWELLVVDVDEEGHGRVASRARCSPGAGGCWANVTGAAFLSLELRLLAPGVALTTIWLNAATQETQSEFAGVTAPLLRIYNEDRAHITFAMVVQVPPDAAEVDAADFRITSEESAAATRGMLVTGSGCRMDAGGALCAWALGEPRPRPLLAATLGDLRERVRRRAATPLTPAAPPEPPDEASVRALCSPPSAACALPAPLVGLVAHPSGRCVWVALGDGGAWCASLPALRPLRSLTSAPAPHCRRPTVLHYVQPAISELYFVR